MSLRPPGTDPERGGRRMMPEDTTRDDRVTVVVLTYERAHEVCRTLSELAELLSDRPIRESLLNCEDPAQMHRILSTWAPYRPAA